LEKDKEYKNANKEVPNLLVDLKENIWYNKIKGGVIYEIQKSNNSRI